jgi:uncharacterized protein (UPF0332 family)
MKKSDFQDLIDAGQLRNEPAIGKDQVGKLLKRARRDLETAHRIKEFDEAIAMQAAYEAMFHSANALLRLHGYRPGPVRQHQGVIAAVSRILPREATLFIKRFDNLRKRRNEFEYQGLYQMGSEELGDALENAKAFMDLIEAEINKT